MKKGIVTLIAAGIIISTLTETMTIEAQDKLTIEYWHPNADTQCCSFSR